MKKSHYFFQRALPFDFSQWLYSRDNFFENFEDSCKSCDCRSVRYDLESFKKFELFLNSLKNLVIFAVLSGYIVKNF